MTRREQVEKLAAEMNATIDYSAPRYGAAVNFVTRVLYLTPWDEAPESEVYWFAMHELGHLARTDELDPVHVQEDPFKDYDAEREASAWTWALDHADFPLDQAGESAIAWGLADRMHYAFEIGPELTRIHDLLGESPDWYFNVTEPEHFDRLDGYAKPNWAELNRRLNPTRKQLPKELLSKR